MGSLHDFFEGVEKWHWVTFYGTNNPIYGTLTAMHYFTLFVLTGTAVAFDLRLLGLVGVRQRVSVFADELFPWLWTALGFALFSGFALWVVTAGDYIISPVMNQKILIVFFGIALTVFIRRASAKVDQSAPGLLKVAAVVSIVTWICAILWGNFIAALCGLG